MLAQTGPESWAETNMTLLKEGKARFDKGEDRPGPVLIAVVITVEQ